MLSKQKNWRFLLVRLFLLVNFSAGFLISSSICFSSAVSAVTHTLTVADIAKGSYVSWDGYLFIKLGGIGETGPFLAVSPLCEAPSFTASEDSITESNILYTGSNSLAGEATVSAVTAGMHGSCTWSSTNDPDLSSIISYQDSKHCSALVRVTENTDYTVSMVGCQTNQETATLTVSPQTNYLANSDFQTNNTSWSVAANPATGWVEVPGNAATYSTSNFLVMQYETKYDCTGDGVGDTAAACSAVADSGLGLDYRDIASFATSKVVSTAEGAPLVHITHTQATTACPTGSHLITNPEWMTIVRNAETVSSNWADNTIGSLVSAGGGLKRGNVGITDSASYDGTDPESGTGRNSKAMLTLSNNSTIWDMSGNVWEHVKIDSSDTLIPVNKQPTLSTTADDGAGTGNWGEFTEIATYQNLSYDQIRPSNVAYNSLYGVGKIWTYGDGETDTSNRVFLRGGYWNFGSGAGVATLNLGGVTSYQGSDVGLRCASDPVAILQSYQSAAGVAGGGNEISIGSIADGKIFQTVNLGNTEDYTLSAYVYDQTTGNVGGTINTSVAQLYVNGVAISTTYTSAGSGWYKLTGTATGANENREYGLLVKKGKTVKVDEVTLVR